MRTLRQLSPNSRQDRSTPLFVLSVIIFLLASSFFSLKAQDDAAPSLQEDFDLMMSWFEGEFNNFQQIWQEEEDSLAQDLRHEHIHSIFKKVDMPKLGQHTFFVKQYMDGDTNNIYRQRVYNFWTNSDENAIQLDIYSFKTPEEEEQYRMANHNPNLVIDLSADDFRSLPGCAVYWQRDGDQFIGYMKEKACHFTSRRSGKEIYITDSLQLTQDEIWIRDEAYDADGNYVFGNKAGIHHKLRRCRYWNGWMAAEKEPDGEEYYLMRGIRLHDQGQRIQLMDKNETPAPYYIELSEVVYSSGLEVLKLAIYEEGNDRSIAYVWANTDADRIGINMRSITAGFSVEKE